MAETTIYRNSLPLATQLQEYRLDAVLGAGTFGMTYLAWDAHLEKKVAVKEYLPAELAVRALDGSVVPVNTDHSHDYQWGLERFLLEARTLARFSHANIVRVNRYFEANGTAYVVMDYESGTSLSQRLQTGPALDDAGLRALLMPLLDGLQAVHEAGFLHRDIKPANLFLRASGEPVLLDFGAARQSLGGATRSLTAVLTPGYAPLEQYSTDGNQGPWTDIYALAGVVYRVIVGENPPDATSRVRHDVVPERLRAVRGRVSSGLLQAVEWAMAMTEKDRPQNVPAWRAAIRGERKPDADPLVPARAAPGVTGTAATPGPGQLRRRRQPVAHGRPFPWRWVTTGLVAAALVGWLSGWQRHDRAPAPVAPALVSPSEGAPRQETEPAIAEVQAAPRMVEPADSAVVGRTSAAGDPHLPMGRGAPGSVADRLSRDRVGRPPDENAFLAEQLRRQAARDFKSADADRNGLLTRDEADPYPLLAREFSRADADGDGRISQQEFARMRRLQARHRMQK